MLFATEKGVSKRLEKLSASGDPLERLSLAMDWKIFLPLLEETFKKERKSEAGRKAYPLLLMFKTLILQSLYNLSDHQTEYQIRDRLSFTRFLGLGLEENTPDEKTIWLFRETLIKAGVIDKLFQRFDEYLFGQGYTAELGTIVDASIISVPKQRNSREENEKIKGGETPETFSEKPNVLRQKDVDARWTQKNNQNYYGYKNHVGIDAKHKIVRTYDVTPANTGDITSFDNLLDPNNSDKKVWGDKAYFSAEKEEQLAAQGYESRVIKRTPKEATAWSDSVRENTRRSKTRVRVEHVFGFMSNSMGAKLVRTIGLVRAKGKIVLTNLVYNICRFEQMERLGIA